MDKKILTESVKKIGSKFSKEQVKEFVKLKSKTSVRQFFEVNKDLVQSLDKSPNSINELSNDLLNVLTPFQDFLKKKPFIGDVVSSIKDNKIIKGKITDETEKSYVIDNYVSGKTEVNKTDTIKLFQGQKFDLRELNNLFSNDYHMSFNKLNKTDVIKLLKGQETSPVIIKTFVNDTFSKEEKIRLKITKSKGKEPILRTIRAFENKIYGVEYNQETVDKIKNGENLKQEFKTSAGKSFSAIVYWDNELNGLRTKSVNSEHKNNLKQNSNSKDEIKSKDENKTEIKAFAEPEIAENKSKDILNVISNSEKDKKSKSKKLKM